MLEQQRAIIARMTRLAIRLAGTLALLFCAALSAPRASPYDDGGLAASLTAPDCAPPCFLGIRPGVTTASDALRLLRALPWVADVQATDERIEWRWNDQPPAFLRGVQTYARILLRNGVVHWIGVETTARVADLRIILGAPDSTYYHAQQIRDSTKNFYTTFSEYVIYPAHGLEAVASTLCPPAVSTVWELPVMLVLPAAAPRFREERGAFVPLPESCR